MKAGCWLISLIISLTIGILLADSSYADIDPETVIGLWLLNESGGDKVMDSSGGGHTGVATGGELKWVEGKFGNALEFSGDGKRVHVEHDDALNLETFTFMMWIKVASTGDFQVVFEKQQAVGAAGHITRNYGLEITPNNAARIWFACDGQIGPGRADGKVVTDEEWHHIAATYDLKEFKIYVDGELGAITEISLKPENNTGPLAIGARMNGNCGVKGLVDEVALFSVALKEQDVQALMKGLDEIARSSAVSPSSKLSISWGQIKTEVSP